MKNEVNLTINKRDIRLEIMRIVAIFFVIFNHTDNYGFYLFSNYDYTDFHFWVYLPFSVFCKFAVPIFFMISGALLLEKKESINDIYKKRVLRMLVVLFLVSLLYYIFDIVIGVVTLYGIGNFFDFIYGLITGNIRGHLWFLYAYIVFLMISPLLKKLVDGITSVEFRCYFIIVLFMSVAIPIGQDIVFVGIDYTPKVLLAYNILNSKTMNIIIFPIIGYYLYYRFDYGKITSKRLCLLWVINVITILITCLFVFFRIVKTGDSSESNIQQLHSMFVLNNASLIFITIRKMKLPNCNKHIWIKSMVLSAGKCVFGIYLIHILVMLCYVNTIIKQMLSFLHLMPLIRSFVYCLIIFLICWMIIFLLKKIPGIKKFI